jgi:hypothetical protein
LSALLDFTGAVTKRSRSTGIEPVFVKKERFRDGASNLSRNLATFRKKRKSTQFLMNHVFGKFATPEVFFPCYYLPLNAETAGLSSISARAVTGDNAIVVLAAVQLLNEKPIARPRGDTGRRKKAARPIAEQNNEDGSKKIAPVKKTWMMRVQHPLLLMVICL